MPRFATVGTAASAGVLLFAISVSGVAAENQFYTAPKVDANFPHPQPNYPDSAQLSGEQGVVAIDLYVRPSGKAAKARISQSSGYEDLDTAALEGVLNWRFVPATSYGDTVSDWTTVKIVYQLPVPATAAPPAAKP